MTGISEGDVEFVYLHRGELYKNRSSRKIDSRRLFCIFKRILLPEDLTENQFFWEDLFLYNCPQEAVRRGAALPRLHAARPEPGLGLAR